MPATKPLSPTELAALEHAFAADPTSREAYRALTEAYLAAGRFMEAMVVCKKGVKAHPDDPSARVLLARVYADQGKDRKALEELAAVLQSHPRDAAANRMAGALHLRLGEKEPGIAALRRAAEAAPGDADVAELLRKHGVAPATAPAAAAPARTAQPSPGGPPVAPRVAPPGARAAAAPAAPPVVARSAAPVVGAAAAAPAPSVDVDVDTPVPASAREAGLAYAKELAEKYATQEFTLGGTTGGMRLRPKKRSGATIATTVALFAVLALMLGGWVVVTKAKKQRIETVDKLLRETKELVEKDSYQGYEDAAARCRSILALDSDQLAGHAYLAYVDAILYADHGDEAAKAEALKNVEAARKLGKHGHLIAAEAYLRFAGGDPAGAVKDLESLVAADDIQSPFLLGALGVLQMRAGDLDAARDTLSKAQKANPGDVRIASALGEQFLRRGDGYDVQASGFFDYALRIQKEHVPSLLGKAELLLDRGQLDAANQLVTAALAPSAGPSPRQQALAHAIRASVLYAQGKPADGKAEDDLAAKIDPSSPDVPDLVGRRKLRDGDAAGAADAFQKALAADPRRQGFYVDLVKALLRKDGGAKQAIDVLKKATTRLGESPRLALLLGDAYRASGDLDLARGQYEKAIQLGHPYPDARVALARMYRAQNNVPGALVELTQAIDEYGQGGTGGAAQAYVEMAETERARGAKKEVLLDLYQKALQRDPASCDALWGAGRLEADGRRVSDQGRQWLGTYAKLCPRGAHAEEAAKLAVAK